MQKDPDEKCDEGWIGVSIALQTLFMITLAFNCGFALYIRIQLVNRIKHFFFYKVESEIAIKY